jgi:hypothetical protein
MNVIFLAYSLGSFHLKVSMFIFLLISFTVVTEELKFNFLTYSLS